MTETEVEESYPMPPSAKDKPLKIDGSEIEYIVLAPKGYKEGAPASAENKGDTENKGEKKEEDMDKPKEDVNKKMETLSAENRSLREKVNQMMLSRREDLATQIVELRAKKGLIEEKDKSIAVEDFKKLDETQLKILLSDAERLEKVDAEVKAEAKVKLSASGSSELTEEQKLRQEWFGHKDPLGDE